MMFRWPENTLTFKRKQSTGTYTPRVARKDSKDRNKADQGDLTGQEEATVGCGSSPVAGIAETEAERAAGECILGSK